MIQTRQLLLLLSLLLPAGAMAQDNETASQLSVPQKDRRMTYEQMTEQMVAELQLDEKQQKKIAKLNKKYKTLIEGEQREKSKGGQPPKGERPSGGRPGGMGGPGSRSVEVKYAGATVLTAGATESGKQYQSTKADESALMVSTKDAVNISQPTINKTGDSDGGDNCSFYGVNAALLVKGGSTTNITGGTITSNATGANGVFSYGGNGGRNGGQGDGTILVGSDSELTLTLAEGSTFTGSICGNITNATDKTISTETGTVNVILGSDCTWMLTADTYITSLTGDASHIKANGHRLFVNNKEMKL